MPRPTSLRAHDPARDRRPSVLPFVAIAAALTACQGNQSGHLAALQVGDTTNPVKRGSPVAELRGACGEGASTPAGAAAIQRQPYLQQVTSSSAMIGWVTSASPDGASVEVSAPGGAVIGVVPAAVDLTAERGPTEHQVWAQIEGLSPNTVYCYALQDSSGALTQRTGFRTAPAADQGEPVRFLALGDSGGGGADQYALLDQMYTVPYDVMIHTGDLAYDNGTIGQFDDNVFGVYADLLRNRPLFPAAGNHDYGTLSGAPFREVFALPGDGGEKWYSYDWGRVHFVALDTESDYGTQAKWLENDLATTTLPWKIIYLHKPPYSSGTHGSDTALRNALAPILQRHGVQLVLAGHDHNYERMMPQDGVNFVVTGGGGIGTRSVGRSSFTAFSEDVIHFVYAEVWDDRLELHSIDGNGSEFDSAVITR